MKVVDFGQIYSYQNHSPFFLLRPVFNEALTAIKERLLVNGRSERKFLARGV